MTWRQFCDTNAKATPGIGIPGREGGIMSLRTRFVGLLVLAASVIGPAASAVSASPSVRVYDREHRDYHRWDSREQRSYRQYLAERRRPTFPHPPPPHA